MIHQPVKPATPSLSITHRIYSIPSQKPALKSQAHSSHSNYPVLPHSFSGYFSHRICRAGKHGLSGYLCLWSRNTMAKFLSRVFPWLLSGGQLAPSAPWVTQRELPHRTVRYRWCPTYCMQVTRFNQEPSLKLNVGRKELLRVCISV